MHTEYQDREPGSDESTAGPSARLALELRILDGDCASPSPMSASSTPMALPAVGPVVLVVSGDADVRNYVQEHLQTHREWRTVEAHSVPRAMALVQSTHPTVVVLDAPEATLLTQPGPLRDGRMPVVLLADAFPAHFEACHSRQVLLPWPFEVNDLVNTVARLMSENGQKSVNAPY